MSFGAQNVVSFFRSRPAVRDWDNNELAQFYRVESALRQAGIFVDTERGLTDEGDPWFVYCRQDSGDVFLHIARFDGQYVAASPSMATSLWRRKFADLLEELVKDNPVVLAPQSRKPSPDLYIHPSTMLIAAVAALFYKNAPLRSEDTGDNPLRQTESRTPQTVSIMSEVYSAALVSAMAIIAVLHHNTVEEPVVESQHEEKLAFLDGILFNRGDSDLDLPRFEGDVTPTDSVETQSGDVIQVATSVPIVEHDNSQSHEGPVSLLQGIVGKFAVTIAAANAAVASAASVAMANHEQVPGTYGGEQVVLLQSHGGSSVVVAENAKAASLPTDVQQVTLPVKPEPVAAEAPPPAPVQLTFTSALVTAEVIVVEPVKSVDETPVVETPGPIVDVPLPEPQPVSTVEVNIMGNGLAVLLMPVDAEDMPNTVPLIGTSLVPDHHPLAIA